MDKTNARYNLVFDRWFNKSSRNQVANYALAIIASQFCGIARLLLSPEQPHKSYNLWGPPNLAIFGDPIDCGQQVRFLLQVKDLWVISEGYSNFALSKKSLLTPILITYKGGIKKGVLILFTCID